MPIEYFFKSNTQGVHKSRLLGVCDEDVGDLESISIPILKLVHTTHEGAAASIKKRSAFQFKPFPKNGRQGGDHKTLKKTSRGYERVLGPLFPGFYSWWSIYPDGDCEYIDEAIEELRVREEERLRVYVPDYLKVSPESIYGNRGFVCNVKDLLSSYVKSRSPDKSMRDVCIRIGGTLLYSLEICYVLIVCLADDSALSGFSWLDRKSKPFVTNDFIRREGKVNPETHESLTFNPEHNVTWVNGDRYSYETAAFAFYFPDQHHCLKVKHRFCSMEDFDHDVNWCVKKKDGVCPNMH